MIPFTFLFLISLFLLSINAQDPSSIPKPTAPSNFAYLGCYSDKLDVRERSLPYYQELSPEMSVEKCLTSCISRGFEYSGLQYERECYCSKYPPKYEQIDEDKCDTKCVGESTVSNTDYFHCGGGLAMSVYRSLVPVNQPNSTRPLLCLSMILKNEAHTILNTLESVRDIIDCYLVLDTGSTDGTQEKIRTYLTHIKGEIVEEPFIDYGASRNRGLDLAKERFNPVFTLVLSADEKVLNPTDLRNFLVDHEWAFGPQHNAYPVIMNAGSKFDSVRVARVDGMWRYVGRVHEYLTSPQKSWVDLYRFTPEIQVQFKATDGDRRFKSQYFIIKILLEDIAVNPTDTRALGYLGSTYNIVGNYTESFKYYGLLAEISGSMEEKYRALIEQAETGIRLKLDFNSKILPIYLVAYQLQPQYMAALHGIAQYYFNNNQPILSYFYIKEAIKIERPEILNKDNPNYKTLDIWIRDTEYLYDYEGQRLMGFVCEAVRDWVGCVNAFNKVLEVQVNDDIVKRRIKNCEINVNNTNSRIQSIMEPTEAESIELAKQKAKLEEIRMKIKDGVKPVIKAQDFAINRIEPKEEEKDKEISKENEEKIAAILAGASPSSLSTSTSTSSNLSSFDISPFIVYALILLFCVTIYVIMRRNKIKLKV